MLPNRTVFPCAGAAHAQMPHRRPRVQHDILWTSAFRGRAVSPAHRCEVGFERQRHLKRLVILRPSGRMLHPHHDGVGCHEPRSLMLLIHLDERHHRTHRDEQQAQPPLHRRRRNGSHRAPAPGGAKMAATKLAARTFRAATQPQLGHFRAGIRLRGLLACTLGRSSGRQRRGPTCQGPLRSRGVGNFQSDFPTHLVHVVLFVSTSALGPRGSSSNGV